MAETQPDPNRIEASPIKEFFISMLVKDIPLTRSILDLVDNCIDGARRLRPDEKYGGLWIRMELEKNRFVIADNCGGIPSDLARHYAFRFGRPKDMPTTKHSVGQFGVGMKRALFKLGKKFKIESIAEKSDFVVEHDVDEWKDVPEWNFSFKDLREGTRKNSVEKRGTTITVESIHPSVASEIASDNFQKRLINEIESAHPYSLEKGIEIVINKHALQARPTELLQSKQILPACRHRRIRNAPVTVRVYSGIYDSTPKAAGWYIFCNGRLVLGADRTETTGWGEDSRTTIPKFHNQFARYRGYVLFESKDASLLPWNTTKTGVDTDSPIYKSVRLQMIGMMRPVIDFLNALKAEIESGGDVTVLQDAVRRAKLVRLSKIKKRQTFKAPKAETIPAPQECRISFKRPCDLVEELQDTLGVSTPREVGEEAFDFYYNVMSEE